MDFNKIVLAKLDKIEENQTAHTVQLAINTQVLTEHHKRSTNLEERLEPIEDHVKFLWKLGKIAVVVISSTGTLIGILSLFFKK